MARSPETSELVGPSGFTWSSEIESLGEAALQAPDLFVRVGGGLGIEHMTTGDNSAALEASTNTMYAHKIQSRGLFELSLWMAFHMQDFVLGENLVGSAGG